MRLRGKAQLSPEVPLAVGAPSPGRRKRGGDGAGQRRGTGTCRVDVGLPRESRRGDSLDLCLPVPLQDVGLTSNERR